MLRPGMTSMAQVVAGDVADLSAPTPPAAQSLANTATTASATWTHSGAPAGTTYACSVIGTDGSTPTATGTGLGAWTWPVDSGVSYRATLAATGTDGQTAQSSALVMVQPDVATDFPIAGSAGWRTVYSGIWSDDEAQGPLAIGAGTVVLGGETLNYTGYDDAGVWGVNNQTNVIPGEGLKIQTDTTGGIMAQMWLDIPLGETLTVENSIRVTLRIKAVLGDATDSVFVYLSDPGITPQWDSASSLKTGGIRLLGTAATLYGRRGSAASSGSDRDDTWADGSTLLWLEAIVPPFSNDVVFRIDPSAGGGDWGRSNSRDTTPTLTLQDWVGGLSTIRLFFAVGNGSSGSGLPSLTIERCSVEVR